MNNSLTQRRVNDGAEALGLSTPMSKDEIKRQIEILSDAARAMQSLDDLGSPEANEIADRDLQEIQRRRDILERRLAE